MGLRRHDASAGARFQLALAVLRELRLAHEGSSRGRSLQELSESLRRDPLQLDAILEQLVDIDWVARLDEDGAQRHVLLCDPANTVAAPLLEALLLEPSEHNASFRRAAGFERLTVAELLAA